MILPSHGSVLSRGPAPNNWAVGHPSNKEHPAVVTETGHSAISVAETDAARRHSGILQNVSNPKGIPADKE
jgi:hypothetical protein